MNKLALIALVAACGVPTATLDPDAVHPHGDAVGGDAPADAPPDAMLKPAMLSASPAGGTSFGDLVLGQSSEASYTLVNDGEVVSGQLSVTLDDPHPAFSISADACSGHALDPMQTCKVTVTFAPTSAGAQMTTLHVTGSPGGDVARTLDGNGLVPGAVSIVSPSFDFGARAVDGGPDTHTFQIENTGQVTIGAPMATIGGSVDSYAVASTTCTQMLAPGATCDVVVRFDPSTVGSKPGSLTVNAAQGGMDAATLIGTGIAHVAVTKAGTGQGSVSSNQQPGITCGSGCAADFSATPVILSATPDVGSTFDGWSSDCTGTSNCTLDLTSGKSVTATFTKLTPKLMVALAGTGMGSVGSSPAGISCGTSCMASFPYGTLVTLSATPQTGSTFAGWSGACSGTTPCTVTMDQMQSVTATFTLNTYALLYGVTPGSTGSGTVDVNPAGTPDCGPNCASYGHGTNVTLTATPAVGSKFDGWTGCTSTTASCTVAMTQARNVTARFTLLTEDLTYTVTGSGSISLAPPGTSCGASCARYDYGTLVVLSASPVTGWSFDSWIGCPSASGTSCTATMDQARTITAKFVIDTYPLMYGKTAGSTGSGNVAVNPAGTPDCGPGCASYAYNTSVTLTASATSGSHFDGWTGCTSTTASCTVAMIQARTVTARFTVDSYTLTATSSASGNISSSPAGIDCGSGATACTASFNYNTQVTLVATPAAGWLFDTWTGACAGTVGTSCTTTILGATTVGATWKHDTKLVMVTTFGSGSVSSSPAGISCGSTCMAMFDVGSTVTLTATPATGYSFTGWTGCASSTNTCTVTVSQALSITATFTINQYTLDWATSGTGSGAVTVNPAGSSCGANCASYDYNTMVTLTATPATGSTFSGWTGCASTSNVCTVTMSQARNVTAAFTLNSYALSVGTSGSGSVKCNNAACASSYPYGTAVTLTATPAAGWVFDSWTGACIASTTATCNLTITGDTSTTAVFKPTLTVAIDAGGTGTGTVSSNIGGISCAPNCSAAYALNQSVVLTASPSPSSQVASWSGGGCSGTGSTCTVTMSQAQSVTVRFDTKTYAVTVTAPTNGKITSGTAINCGTACTTTVAHGSSMTFTATPATGYLFSAWTGACAGNTTATCTVTVTSPISVGAMFAQDTRQLSVTISGGGSVSSAPAGISCSSGNCTASFPYGQSVTLTATPATGYSFGAWSGACTGSSSTCTVTMDQARSVTALFDLNSYALTVTAPSGGKITSSPAGIDCGTACSQTYSHGTTVNLTATPATGYQFVQWTGACSGSSATCTLTMTGPKTVGATFAIIKETLNVGVNGSGSGSVSSSPAAISCPGPACAADFDYGTVVTLTANPAVGSSFGGWSGACIGAGTCTVTMNQVQNVTATFNINSYTVTVGFSGSGSGSVNFNGTVCTSTCSKALTYGTPVTLTPSPGTNVVFSGWSGAPCSGTGTCSFTVTGGVTTTAKFDLTYLVTVSHWFDGDIVGGPINCGTGPCQVRVVAGSSFTLSFQGYSCGSDNWRATKATGCVLNVTSQSCPVTVNADTTITVTADSNSLCNTN